MFLNNKNAYKFLNTSRGEMDRATAAGSSPTEKEQKFGHFSLFLNILIINIKWPFLSTWLDHIDFLDHDLRDQMVKPNISRPKITDHATPPLQISKTITCLSSFIHGKHSGINAKYLTNLE